MTTLDQLTETTLARLGLGSESVPSLVALGVWGDAGALPDAEPIIRALASCANADRALIALERLAEHHPEAWAGIVAQDAESGGDDAGSMIRRVTTIAGASSALGDLLVRSPEALTALTGGLSPWDVERVRGYAAEDIAAREEAPAHTLARLQRRGLLRIAARDLLGMVHTPTVAAELADLAEGIVAGALDHVLATEPLAGDASLAIVGMGKLGGRELNYVSDIDLVFAVEGEWRAATQLAERLLRLLGEPTPDGRVYEVDTNLRPEGRDGPLVRTLESYASYYERWAKTWEFQALLKARPLAGSGELGARFAALAERFVWPNRLDAGQVGQIQDMKAAVEHSRQVQRDGARQIKLAPGGLRDIEFAVQLLQLVHGRHDRALRSPNTLEGLLALAEGGYVDDGDAELFRDAYQFLRTVEHRLQLARLRRTHTVPSADAERSRLARSVGFRDVQAASALEQFDREYASVQANVRRLHEKLFYRPLLERFAELGSEEQLAGQDGGLDEDAARERLAALGFDHPDGALRHLRALASGLTRKARLFRTLLPAILPVLAAAPDPDTGLKAFRSLADRLGESPSFLRTLRDNPPVGELLARVLGASQLVGEWLERQPEVFSQLADLEALGESMAPAAYRRLATGLLKRSREPDAAGTALRRMKRREVARIAVRDLGGRADVVTVGHELTGLAEACLEAALEIAVPADLRMAVIGMGKLGGRELGYASDLDVLLVFEPASAHEQALGAAERLITTLSAITPEGQAFHIDTNLRPEGKDGPLARSLDSYRTYYERWAQTWELQALTLARPVAGDPDLGAAFIELAHDLVYPEQVPAQRLHDVRRMKARVERERAAHGRRGQDTPRRFSPRRPRAPGEPRVAAPRVAVSSGDRVNLKLGLGGLADVEWTLQLLQLRHGGKLARLRVPGTLAVLEACAAEGLLDGQDVAWLREGWLLLSRVRNALYLAGERDSSVLPARPAVQEHVARMLGFDGHGSQAFTEELTRVMRRVRKAHERCFYDA